MDVYPCRKCVILVTTDAYKDLIPTGYAAIIYNTKKWWNLYCSQLIYVAYLDKFGIDLNTGWFDVGSLHLGELVLSPETYKIYQK